MLKVISLIGRIMDNKYRVWLDIIYPPHVLFFDPIIKEIEKRGHTVIVTAREAFETCDLLRSKGVKFHTIGTHPGKLKIKKIFMTISRAIKLVSFVSSKDHLIAVSINSMSQGLAAKLLGIPWVIFTDYEHTMYLPSVWFLKKLIVPEAISDGVLKKRMVDLQKVKKYPALKEEVYLSGFQPNPSVLDELKIRSDSVIVTVRPPATAAHYHNPEAEVLLFNALDYLVKDAKTCVVLVARREQKEIIGEAKMKYGSRIIIPEKTIDGLNLIWHSDLVISGGGTMNREAAVLGVPAYSIFRGTIGAVDRYLENSGKLTILSSSDDIRKIRIEKKKSSGSMQNNKNLVCFIVDEILKAGC
jgi:predicted glycosyltransferase